MTGSGRKKKIIGIMGGIASGKSSVEQAFGKLGCAVINADKIAHAYLENNSVIEKLVNIFGQKILDPNGKIDHRNLAQTAFTDSDRLAQLNNIVHPAVLSQVEQLIEQYNGQKGVKAIVLDIPLLVETNWHRRCDKLVFIDCDPQIRVARAKNKGFSDENQIKMRENFQISLDTKLNLADNIINNNSDFSTLVRQVADIFSNIVNNG